MAKRGSIGSPDSILLANAPRLDSLNLALQLRSIPDNQRVQGHLKLLSSSPAGR